MVRRHPHVFGDAAASTSEEVLRNWEQIKKREKAEAAKSSSEGASSKYDLNVPPPPALQRAYKNR